MRITWDTDCNAPCVGRIVAADGRDVLIQSDWDYPGVASTFGWSTRFVQRCKGCGKVSHADEHECDCRHVHTGGCCWHDGTDGTVDCGACGVTVADFLASAREWLDDNGGAEADDPGYFGDE